MNLNNGFFRFEVKVINRYGKTKAGTTSTNSSIAAAAYISSSEFEEQLSDSTAAASYISGQEINNNTTQAKHDYTKKKGVLYSKLNLPLNAPPEFIDNPEALFNSLEQVETSKNPQLYREFIISFEASLVQDGDISKLIQVGQEFVSTLVDEGMAAYWAIHGEKKNKRGEGNNNYHMHILCPMRGFKENGEWDSKTTKRSYALDDNGNRIPELDAAGKQKRTKNGSLRWVQEKQQYKNNWNNPQNARRWRETFAQIENQYLDENHQVNPNKDYAFVDDHEFDYQINIGQKRSKKEQAKYEKQVELVEDMDSTTRAAYIDEILRNLQSQYRHDYYTFKREDKEENYKIKQIIYETKKELQRELYFSKKNNPFFRYQYISHKASLIELVVGALLMFLYKLLTFRKRALEQQRIENCIHQLENDLLLLSAGEKPSFIFYQDATKIENLLVKNDFEVLGKEIKSVKTKLKKYKDDGLDDIDYLQELFDELDTLRAELNALEIQRDMLQTQLNHCGPDLKTKMDIYLKEIISQDSIVNLMIYAQKNDLYRETHNNQIIVNNDTKGEISL